MHERGQTDMTGLPAESRGPTWEGAGGGHSGLPAGSPSRRASQGCREVECLPPISPQHRAIQWSCSYGVLRAAGGQCYPVALRWASQNGLSAGSARTLSTQGQSLRQSGLPGGLPPVVRTTGAIPPVVRTTEHIRPVVRTTGGMSPVVRATGGSSRHVANRQRASHMGTRVRTLGEEPDERHATEGRRTLVAAQEARFADRAPRRKPTDADALLPDLHQCPNKLTDTKAE